MAHQWLAPGSYTVQVTARNAGGSHTLALDVEVTATTDRRVEVARSAGSHCVADPARAGHAHLVQQCHQLLGVGSLTRRDPRGERASAPVGHSVDLRGQSPTGATQALPCPRIRRGEPLLRAPAAC